MNWLQWSLRVLKKAQFFYLFKLFMSVHSFVFLFSTCCFSEDQRFSIVLARNTCGM